MRCAPSIFTRLKRLFSDVLQSSISPYKTFFFFKDAYRQVILVTALLIVSSANVNAGIVIDSVATTESFCANNGTATVYAKSTPNPFLLYAIVSGPVSAPIQNSPVFNSLYPGTYTLHVYDNNFDSLETQFTIIGTYRLPSLSLTGVNPTCPGNADGEIKCHPDTSRGLMPFTYEIISPFLSGSQSAEIFTNLQSGVYDVRMTDGCGNYQTRTITLGYGGTGLTYYGIQFPVYINKIGCDTLLATMQIQINKEKGTLPLTLTVNTSAGQYNKTVYAQVLDTFNYSPGLYQIIDTVIGVTYGNYLSFSVTDLCGVSIYSTPNTVAPFDYDYMYYNTQSNCNVKIGAYMNLKSIPWFPYYQTTAKDSVKLTVYDVATGLLADSMTCYDFRYCGLTIKPLTPGNTYQVNVVDGCGDVYQNTIIWPTLALPLAYVNYGPGCYDSTAVLYVNASNFLSGLTLELLSGPTAASSTKHGYEYNDTIVYPQKFHLNVGGGSIKDLPLGTYQYLLYDSCGNSIRDSVIIYSVSDLSYNYYIKRGCQGANTLFFDPIGRTYLTVACNIHDLAGNQLYYKTNVPFLDSLSGLSPGKYIIEIFYSNGPNGGQYFDTSLIANHISCWVLRDTIEVPVISNTSFVSNRTIFCNGSAYVQLEVDSNTGVPPYKYEIISGPQVFAPQDSSFFLINSFGNYVVRIGDGCGNSNIQQISVDSASFPPLVKNGSLCPGNRVVLSGISSSYFSYDWHLPDGSVFSGDSLVIDPLTPADTGMYRISKIVHINGCTDTLYASYHISLHDAFIQSLNLCNGDTIYVGTNAYTFTGNYIDTLINVSGCDSIVTSNLVFGVQDTIRNNKTICFGDSALIGSSYYSTTGIYTDSVLNPGTGCRDIIITDLKANRIADTLNADICAGDSVIIGIHSYKTTGTYNDTLISALGCDSVIILDLIVQPLKKDSINKRICAGENYAVGTSVYAQTGIYRDTLNTSTCDSIVILNLIVDPYKRDSVSSIICSGESFTVGTNVYAQSGIYIDTLATSGCDSIVVLNLTVNSIKRDSVSSIICSSESLTVGTSVYTQSGIYSDTLATSGCDSIVVLNLTVNPFKRDSINRSICSGESLTVGTSVYTQSGIYSDTLATSGCDSIVVLNLTVNAYKRDSISSIICSGESLTVGTSVYTQSGIYSDTLATSGCDSIVVLNLTVNSIKRDSISSIICSGESLTVGTSVYTQSGIYSDTLATSGCDSIVVLNLTVNAYKRDSISSIICSGDSYTVGTSVYTQSGIYSDTLTTSGCDSIVVLNLTVNAYKRDSISSVICRGESLTVGTSVYTQSGIYRDTLSTSGCDSILTLNLIVSDFKRDSLTVTACEGDTISFGNSFYTRGGIFRDTIATSTCDSISIMNLIFYPVPVINITASDILVYPGTEIQLNTATPRPLTYNWSGNADFNDITIQNPKAVITSSTWIIVEASNSNSCSVFDSVFIDLEHDSTACAGSTIFIPNAFTPNGDGLNERFSVKGENITIRQIEIFNRWGAMIFESKNSIDSWDGTYQNEIVSGIYVVLVYYTECNENKIKRRAGSVYLLN